jgi:uncharacterized protein (TIGR03083 family)
MNAVDILKYGHFTFEGTLKGLSEDECGKSGVCGRWSVKDLVAHLASYECLLSDILMGFVQPGQPTPSLQKMISMGAAAFNDAEVDERAAKSYAEVLAEYQKTYADNLQLIQQLPAETLRQNGTLPWYGTDYSLDDFIVYSFYGHKREHAAQIEVFKDRAAV